MRLIDADALYAALMEESAVLARGTGRNCMAFACKSVAAMIPDAPTIDAVPVRHGRWIDRSGGIEGAWNYCSVCGEQAIDLYDYCPNCGAKMDEAEP